ncbi:hypothetical protein E2C01_050821 [Portunus trituberculatus]|uniref:Uncharacterized protein n=1 Tax=Portunus trituberculatus TaxID=210409 RepID=A0A5B7GHD4_PORTR|nr:hypothetical protein [Portunus trituberculatus]
MDLDYKVTAELETRLTFFLQVKEKEGKERKVDNGVREIISTGDIMTPGYGEALWHTLAGIVAGGAGE